jgi:hypothetical protein
MAVGIRIWILCMMFAFSGNEVAFGAHEENAPSIQEACGTVLTNCRHDLTVHFRQLDGTEYRKTFELTYPPVQNKTLVTIFPGETLHRRHLSLAVCVCRLSKTVTRESERCRGLHQRGGGLRNALRARSKLTYRGKQGRPSIDVVT